LRFKLRTKIIAWSFIPTAIILLLVAVTTYISYQNVTEDEAIQRDAELTRLSASELSAGFEEYIDRLNNLARHPGVTRGVAGIQRATLRDFSNQLVLFDAGAYLLNNLGEVVATSPEMPELYGQDWSDRAFFREMVRNPDLVISDIEADGPNGEDVISIAVPVEGDNNKLVGVALGMFRLDAHAVSPLYGTLIRLRIGRTGSAYLVDGNGRVIYASDINQIGREFGDYPAADEALAGQVGAVRTRSPEGRDVVTGYAPVPRTQWTLVVEEAWAELIRPSLGLRRTLLVMLALGVIIPTFVVMVGVRRITGPINDFIGAAQRIADGDFSQPISVPTGDELEGLANQFNAMAAQLKESYELLETRVEQRTQELYALNAVAEVVSRSLDLERILPDALEEAIEVMGMEGGAIFRLEEESGRLVQVAHRNLGPDMVALGDNLPIDSSIIRLVLDRRQPVARLVKDYPPGRVRAALEKDGWQTVVSIPLVAQEKVLGAINATSRKIAPPRAENLRVPAAIGQQIGVAIDNARLYAQSVEYARQMELARQAADAANASKSTFLANVSHELRTPLVSILGFARIVQKRLDERLFPHIPDDDSRTAKAKEQVDENLEIILAEGQRLTTMINNLLDLEKIEAGKMEWRFQPVSIGDTIRHAAAATAALFEGKPLSLVLDIPNNLPMVKGDPDKLLQVAINLISNAVKFSPQGTILVGACLGESAVTVRVSDQGIGIAPEDQVHLFEKFTQVGDAMTGKPKGTGLGLAISKEIVEHHAGRIWVESRPGEGSTFSFTLPLAEESVEVLQAESQNMADML
jgi:signal transduction histidine kinase